MWEENTTYGGLVWHFSQVLLLHFIYILFLLLPKTKQKKNNNNEKHPKTNQTKTTTKGAQEMGNHTHVRYSTITCPAAVHEAGGKENVSGGTLPRVRASQLEP